MCSCGKNKRPRKEQMIEAVGSTLPFLKYTFCAYEDQFKAYFSKMGIDIVESNLPDLAKAYESGADKSGSTIVDGKAVTFSVQDAIDSIDTSKPVKNNCAIA